MPQADGGNEEEEEQQQPQQEDQQQQQHGFPNFSLDMKANTMRTFKALRRPFLACSFSSKPSTKTCKNLKRITWKRLETERNMQLALERQGRDIVEMRKQLNLWTRNTSAREAYTCWAHQQSIRI
ncbi:hypothetical protein PIB30_094564 [Stylosanthes scabra]|uniref:Uncharacterized protein n=1 Tax=Stylosanthes scabra TaxID=79078 RepID=A0ABU6VVF3_9FABA|nr:hypothetical protein [Stylosanthes scabra]